MMLFSMPKIVSGDSVVIRSMVGARKLKYQSLTEAMPIDKCAPSDTSTKMI